jgi:hypothetical protein
LPALLLLPPLPPVLAPLLRPALLISVGDALSLLSSQAASPLHTSAALSAQPIHACL